MIRSVSVASGGSPPEQVRQEGGPCVLCIGGLDPTGGAGLAADLRTCAQIGVGAAPVATCVAVQDGGGVRAVHPVAPDVLRAQVGAAMETRAVRAVKVGAVPTAELVTVLADVLRAFDHLPVVIDPVDRASAGGALVAPAAARALWRLLLPKATVVTPNLEEFEAAGGGGPILGADRVAAAARMRSRWFSGGRRPALLVTGGHAPGDTVDDLLVEDVGATVFSHRRLPVAARGTGCTLAAAVSARLAQGAAVREAAHDGVAHVHRLLERCRSGLPVAELPQAAFDPACRGAVFARNIPLP